jgi:hypothetical protein
MIIITTATGTQVSLKHPLPGSIDLRTIAHHLSLINRFNGATCRPYSLAEHSLLICRIAERELHLDVHGQFAALMLAAHKAYVGDVSAAAEDEIGAPWNILENRFVRLVRNGFALNVAHAAHAQGLLKAALIAEATARARLLPATDTPSPTLPGLKPVPWVNLMSPACRDTTWSGWRNAFIERADSLDFQRQQFASRLVH